MNPHILKAVELMAHLSGSSVEEILSPSRSYPLSYLRYCIFWQLWNEDCVQWTQQRIANEFKMNHATVCHGIQKINDVIRFRTSYRKVGEIQEKFNKLYKGIEMKKIYLSAPIGNVKSDEKRYQERYNFFKEKEKHYTELGYYVVNPMDNGLSRDADDFANMKKDYELINSCDAILLLENWNRSAGCHSELTYAISIGKEVYIEKALTLE